MIKMSTEDVAVNRTDFPFKRTQEKKQSKARKLFRKVVERSLLSAYAAGTLIWYNDAEKSFDKGYNQSHGMFSASKFALSRVHSLNRYAGGQVFEYSSLIFVPGELLGVGVRMAQHAIANNLPKEVREHYRN